MNHGISVTADPQVGEDLRRAFADYVISHPSDVREVLALPEAAPVRIHIASDSAAVTLTQGADGPKLTVSLERARKTLAVLDIREMSHGANLLPSLHVLGQRGVLDEWLAAAESGGLALETLARKHNPDRPERNLGNLYVAAKLLALQGWLRLEGRDESTRCLVTPSGQIAFETWRRHRDTFALVHRSIRHHRVYRVHIREPECEARIIDEYRAMTELMSQGWRLSDSDERADTPESQRVLRHLRKHLDGTLLTATLVAIGMPGFASRDGRQVQTDPSLLEQLNDSGELDTAQAAGTWSPSMVQIAMDVVVHHGLFERVSDTRIRLTEAGKVAQSARIPYYSALPMSYQRMHEYIEDYYFGDPDPLGVASDGHVDRLMNIWGVGGAISGGLANVVCNEFLHRIFDESPLAEQPAGIADMGCGSGASLRRMAEYICDSTNRGRHLGEYPLFVVGADFSEISRQRTRAALDALAARDGVHTAVLVGDVTDPRAYDEAIRGLNFRTSAHESSNSERPLEATDFLHSMFHLTHERAIQIDDDERAATILADAIKAVEPADLQAALALSSGRSVTLPDGDEALRALVSDQFRTCFARRGQFVRALWAAADLIDFLRRWTPYCGHGLIIAEAHSPRPEALLEPVPAQPQQWMRLEKIGHTCWSNQALGDQYPLPFVEHELACILAGMTRAGAKVYAGGTVTLDLFTGCCKRTMERSLGLYHGR